MGGGERDFGGARGKLQEPPAGCPRQSSRRRGRGDGGSRPLPPRCALLPRFTARRCCGGAAAHLRERRGAVRGRGAAPRIGNPATSARVSLGNLGYSSSLPGGRRRARTRGEARGYFGERAGVSHRCAPQEVAGTPRWSGAVLTEPGARPGAGRPEPGVCGAGWHIACRAGAEPGVCFGEHSRPGGAPIEALVVGNCRNSASPASNLRCKLVLCKAKHPFSV